MIPRQMTLLPEQVSICDPIGDWSHENELGTEIFLVPNCQNSELGTRNLGLISVPNSDWKPPIGCLQEKVIKSNKYWYWRYYDQRGKKRSLYLGTEYRMAIIKARVIGVPKDAKLPKSRNTAVSVKAQA
jgi:hypothetical protein